ncbi:alpha/beta hydrolase [Myxococcus landrumensis]|uniref:Phospholipase n=1 Tax=Myxococcus landrumensis TaxID=2813577 RepID=A0ABX7MWJ3_9BACT|nr:phospholipase [Myxococcus landrumus]QSQ10802.1 phospholipase [Myxococcus landrumus]
MGAPKLRRVSTRLGELDCQVVEGLPEGKSPELAVVLCHGFGAPAGDLVPLAGELAAMEESLAQRVRFIFPGAPLSLAEWGMPTGRAWFTLPEAIMRGQMRDWAAYAKEVPAGLPAARRAVTSVVAAVSTATKLPFGKIVLGGFSQGGMVTTDVALRLEECPSGLCILSGTLLAEAEWRQKAKARQGLPVFQSHGRHDNVLPFSAAERLRDMLVQEGLTVDFLPFDGPHTIDGEELERMAAFLKARLGS